MGGNPKPPDSSQYTGGGLATPPGMATALPGGGVASPFTGGGLSAPPSGLPVFNGAGPPPGWQPAQQNSDQGMRAMLAALMANNRPSADQNAHSSGGFNRNTGRASMSTFGRGGGDSRSGTRGGGGRAGMGGRGSFF